MPTTVIVERTEIRCKSYRHWMLEDKTWENIVFFGVDFAHSNLSRSTFKNCSFENVLFTYARVVGATFTDCTFKSVDFENTDLQEAQLERCEFENVLFQDTEMTRARIAQAWFKDSHLLRTSFRNASLSNVRFARACNMSGVTFDDATLLHVTFENPTITNGRFRSAHMRHVDFTGNGDVHMTTFNGANMAYIAVGSGISYSDLNFVNTKRRQVGFAVNERMIKCPSCGEKKPARMFVGKVKACQDCKRMGNYSQPNERRMGRLSNLPPFSFEFEIDFYDHDEDDDYDGYDGPVEGERDDAEELLLHGFIKTSDGSVSEEWKSPIYMNVAGFNKAIPTLDKLASAGLVRSSCGTHIHVQFSDGSKSRLRNHFSAVMGGMVDRMCRHEKETRQFWGRYFVSYASAQEGGRYHWLNTGSDKPTIEFRLAKYRNGEQFSRLVDFVRRLSKYLDHELSYARSPEAYRRIGERVTAMYMNAVESMQVKM